MRAQVKKFDLSYKVKFDYNNQIKFWFVKPRNDRYQKITNFHTNLKPIKKYNDKQGNQILYFDVKGKNGFQVDLSAEFSKDSEKLFGKDWLLSKSSEVKRYLRSELFLEQTPAIKKLTKELINNKNTLYSKVMALFDFVVDNFKYRYPVKNRGSEKLNLKNLQGDCGEYSTLLVVMLRILGIPAKNQTGFVFYPKYKKAVEHAWVSAYLGRAGWLDFDPQYAAIEKNKAKYFGKRSDYRIVFTNGYNIPIKPAIGKDYKIDFWNKFCLPITRKSVQVLQPCVFVGRNKIVFKDKFTIKK